MRKLFQILLLAVDAALLVVILRAPKQPTSPAQPDRETTQVSLNATTKPSSSNDSGGKDSNIPGFDENTRIVNEFNTDVLEELDIPTPVVSEALPAQDSPGYDPPAPSVPDPLQFYSGVERPTGEDFSEWYIHDVYRNGIPDGAVRLTEHFQITGDWKAMIYNDPEQNYDSAVVELMNIGIYGTEDAPTMTLDFCSVYLVASDESYSTADNQDSTMTAVWDASLGGLSTYGYGKLELYAFYAYEGKEYAIGLTTTPDGIPGVIAMVRP